MAAAWGRAPGGTGSGRAGQGGRQQRAGWVLATGFAEIRSRGLPAAGPQWPRGMKGALGSPVAAAAAGAAMQESFGCVVANRFHQLLDDESDPFDILREAEHRRQQQLQRKRRDEAAAAGAGNRGGRSPAGASGHRPGAGGGRRESQKERKSLPAPGAQQPDSPGGGPLPPGTRAPPGTWAPPGRRGGREGKENGVMEVTPPRPPLDPQGGPDPETEGASGKAWVKLRVLVAEEGRKRGREGGVTPLLAFPSPLWGWGGVRAWSKGLTILELSLYKLGKVEGYWWGGVCGGDNWGSLPRGAQI